VKRDTIQLYGAIEKFDAAADGSLMVSGIASTEAVDADGEIVTADAMRKALPSYLQCGTVREMHQPIAAGNPISAHVDDDGKTHFTAHIVDAGTIAKIKANVLKGFSIGGKEITKVGNKITEILLKDISVVDLPNNPESFFTVIKFEKPAEKKEKCKDDCDCDDCKKSKKEKSMSAELLKKVDDLTTSLASLAKTVETLSKQTPPDLTKMEKSLGDLEKRATDAAAALVEQERSSVIAKMQSEGRVAMKDDGTAYKSDELAKMDLPLLKFAARNAQILPTIAKATYSGTGNPPEVQFTKKDKDGKEIALSGSELIQKAWGGLTLEKMMAAGTTANLTK
jgi:hypothetical protein